jgi:hypothetical protein
VSQGLERLKFGWTVIVFVVSLGVTALVAYNAAANTMSNRVTALEVQQGATEKREQSFHEATDRRFVELREQLKEVNEQLRALVTIELQRGRER